jgi:hypothetical protein
VHKAILVGDLPVRSARRSQLSSKREMCTFSVGLSRMAHAAMNDLAIPETMQQTNTQTQHRNFDCLFSPPARCMHLSVCANLCYSPLQLPVWPHLDSYRLCLYIMTPAQMSADALVSHEAAWSHTDSVATDACNAQLHMQAKKD